jgi:hypothetical protein
MSGITHKNIWPAKPLDGEAGFALIEIRQKRRSESCTFAFPKSMKSSGRTSTARQSIQFQRVPLQLTDLIAVIEIL